MAAKKSSKASKKTLAKKTMSKGSMKRTKGGAAGSAGTGIKWGVKIIAV